MNYRDHFNKLADYNRWANGRIYAAAAALPDEARNRDVGVFFKSLQGTLHHLIATDNAWMSLLLGEKIVPMAVSAASPFEELLAARLALDQKLKNMVGSMSVEEFETIFSYSPWSGDFKGLVYKEEKKDVLTHLFNHHTHHRGHAHTALSLLGVQDPPALDLFAQQITATRA